MSEQAARNKKPRKNHRVPISRARRRSEPCWPKTLSGSRSRRFRQRHAWLLWGGNLFKAGLAQPGVKVLHGVKLMPHKHPEDQVYTVISGVFYIGLGDEFDADKLQAYAPGSVIVLPGNTSHFHWAKSGEYVTQVTAIGPLGMEYINPNDDPRNQEPNA